ncbi:PilZ domain-containing protein [Nitrospira sp. NS4]|uniref:PilZ domain-containing protein n=1 Tax=Nitrospira sp. NS4 TaxID=3414498 RepID=UPI003C2D7E6E
MNVTSEHRDGVRYPIQLLASFTVGNTEGREDGFTMDLSPRGCCLSVKEPLPLWRSLSLVLRPPDDDATIAIERAEVRWAMGNRCGIEFLSMSRTNQDRLRRYLVEYEALHRDDQFSSPSDLVTAKRP